MWNQSKLFTLVLLKSSLGQGVSMLGLCWATELILWTGEVFCLLHWKGNEIQGRLIGLLIGGQKVCNYTRNWNQPQTRFSSTSDYFYLFTVPVHVTFYMFLRDGCFFKHLPTETINHNCSGKELLTLQFASKISALSPGVWKIQSDFIRRQDKSNIRIASTRSQGSLSGVCFAEPCCKCYDVVQGQDVDYSTVWSYQIFSFCNRWLTTDARLL